MRRGSSSSASVILIGRRLKKIHVPGGSIACARFCPATAWCRSATKTWAVTLLLARRRLCASRLATRAGKFASFPTAKVPVLTPASFTVTAAIPAEATRLGRAPATGVCIIIRAYYGQNNRTTDVKQLLRGQVCGDTLVLQVTNSNLGGDPWPGADKVLTVIYRMGGREQTATVREGNVHRIPSVSTIVRGVSQSPHGLFRYYDSSRGKGRL